MKAPKAEDRRKKRTRLFLSGMSWRQACLESGYSLATANRGPKGYLSETPMVVKDFQRAAEHAIWKPETLKKIVTHRLATSVIEGRPSNVAREAELIGKMKDVDLFARNADVQIGIFASLSTADFDNDPAVKALDDPQYHEEQDAARKAQA